MTLAVLRATTADVARPPKIAVIRIGENTAEAARQAVASAASANESAASAAAALAAAGVGEQPDTATGLGATSIGARFWVDQGDGTGKVYLHEAGPVATYTGQHFILDITDDGAAALIGIKENGTSMASRTVDIWVKEGLVSLKSATGAAGDDSTDNATPFANAAAEASSSGRGLLIPKGTFQLATVGSIPAGGMVIEGQGEDSVLKVGASNMNLLEMISGGNLRLYNLMLIGDGTSTSSSNGNLLHCADSDDIDIDSVIFQLSGFAGVKVDSIVPTQRKRLRVRNCDFLEGKDGRLVAGTTAGESADIHIRGLFRDTIIENILSEASATNPISNALTCSRAVDGEEWKSVIASNWIIRGRGKRGLSLASELEEPEFNSGIVQISKIQAFDVAMEAIKTKYIDRIQMVDIYCEGCDSVAEDAVNGLQGTIFINGADDVQADNVIVKDGGSDGFRALGRRDVNTTGIGQARWNLTAFHCSGVGQAALYVGFGVQGMNVNSMIAYDCGRQAAVVAANTGKPAPTGIHFNHPIVRRVGLNGGAERGNAIDIIGVSGGPNVGRVTVNQPDIEAAGQCGVLVSRCDEFEMIGGSIYDSGQSGGGAATQDGIRLGNVTKAKIRDVTSSNLSGTTQQYGISLAAGNGDLDLKNNDFSGNTTGAVNYTAPTTIRAHGNRGWQTVSVTWDPASLATGAATNTNVTIPNASLGDSVKATHTSTLNNLVLTANISAAATARNALVNCTGGTLDVASGTLTNILEKINP